MNTSSSQDRPPRGSRYYRPRRSISWLALLLGIVLGIGGGLYLAWQVIPIEEVDTEPWQLNEQNRRDFVVAIMLGYAQDGDLGRAVTRLLELRPSGDPIQYVADVACSLARSGYVDSASGERAIRAMMTFYTNQGRTGCATSLLPPLVMPTSTPSAGEPSPTPPRAPTKTSTPTLEPLAQTLTPDIRVVPTVIPQGAYTVARLEQFCDDEAAGLLEVYVQDSSGNPLPGQRVRVEWRNGRSDFVTGLKPGQSGDYADFVLDTGISYTVQMPGLSDPSRVFTSESCVDFRGRTTQSSYRAVFRPSF